MRVALALVVSLVVAAPVSAARLEKIATAAGPAVSDGRSYAAWENADGSVTVIDDRERIRTVQPPPPTTCDQPSTDSGQQQFSGVGGNWVMFSACEGSGTRVTLVSLESGATHRLVPFGRDVEAQFPVAIGFHWIKVEIVGYHYRSYRYVDWRSERATDESLLEHAKEAPVVDDERLWVPLCSPLERRRRPDTSGDGAPYVDFQYERPYALTSTPSDGYEVKTLLLKHCGRSKPTVLARCGYPCWDPQLGGRLVTWLKARGDDVSHGQFVVALRLRDMKKFRWPTKAVGQVVHTAHRVFVSRRIDGGYEIRVGRIPR
jgi:hypothetical protein